MANDAPDTLPANFSNWDHAPDTLPADFKGWDAPRIALRPGGPTVSVTPPQPPPAPAMREVGPAPGVASHLYEAGKNILGLPGMVYHSLADAPRTPEEAGIEAGAAPSVPGMGAGRLALATKRLLVDPQTQTYQQGQQMEDEANRRFGPPTTEHPLKRALFGPTENPLAMFLPSQGARNALGVAGRPMSAQEQAMRETAGAYKKAALVPLVGPLAAHLATTYQGSPLDESASAAKPYGTEGDPAGALTEGLAYAAAPEVTGRIKTELKPLLPTVEDIRGPISAVGKSAGLGLTPEEMITKAGGPSVQGQEGANLARNLRVAGPRLVEQDKIRKIDSVEGMADGAYMASRRVWEQGYEPQIARHPNATLDAAPIGEKIRTEVDPATRDLFPEQGEFADNFAKKFNGPMTLEQASGYVKALNAKLRGYYKLTPEQRAAADITDGRISAYESAADGLRDSIDSTLAAAGEHDPAGLRQEYGALKGIQRIFDKRKVVTGRQNLFNLPQMLAMGGGALEASGSALAGHPLMAIAGAAPFAATTAAKYLTSPDVLVRRGIRGLAKTSEEARPLGPPSGPAGGAPPVPAAPGTPPVAPPWTGAGQRNIQFTGGTNVPAQATPAVPPPTGPQAPATPNLPLFRQAQTPAPAETAPAAAPKAQRGASSYTPEQQGAIDQAVAHANNGVHDEATHQSLREQARRPELEPESLRGKDTQKANQVDGEYTPERAKLHTQQIRQVLGEESEVPEKHPVVIFQGGGAASGKTEALGPELAKKYPGIAVSDSDVIKFGAPNKGFKGGAVSGLPEAETLKQSDPLGAADRLHEETSDITKEISKEARRRKQSLIIDGVGGNPEKLQQQIKEFKDAGYRVEVHYADKDTNLALKGMARRFQNTQRWVPPNVLVEGHEKAANAYHVIAGMPEVDEASLRIAAPKGPTDVGKTTYELVHQKGDGYNEVKNPDLYAEHERKGAAYSGRNRLQGRKLDGEGPAGAAGGGPGGGTPGQAVPGEPGTVEAGTRPEGGGGNQEVAPLHLAENAPPKDKPVTLIYGGAFSPAHEGHIAAVQAAHDQLTSAGYKVDRILVAPTADKLLAKKEGASLPLEGRARIASAQFPKEINGTPVEVSTGPGQEVEQKQGKPRRTDLADFAQRENPGHTVINVAGKDAAVPGSPDYNGPKLYQGAPGSNHAGYNYFEVPRIGGHSSTAIREAIANGTPVPGMTPEAERVYREELAKQQAPISTAPAPRQVVQGERIAGQDGNATSVLTPTGNKLAGRYRVVEGDTLTPSHDPLTFAKNPNYPTGVQERAYHSSKEAQARVMQQEQQYDPAFTLSDDPTGQNGPAIVTPDGTVLGGNSRVMTSQRLYEHGKGDVYKKALIDKAQQFGLDPEQIRGMKRPTLVREIDAPASADELRRIGSDLNKPMSGALGVSERAVSAGKSLKSDSLNQIGTMMDQLGEGATLRKLLSGPSNSRAVLDILQRDGVITDRERPAFVDTESGGLSEEGKTFVERALRGRVIENPDLLDNAPKSILNKLDPALPDLAMLGARGDEYNLPLLVRAALRDHIDAGARGQSIGEFYGDVTPDKNFGNVQTNPLFPPPKANPVIEALGRALAGTGKNFRESVRKFAKDARFDPKNQGTLSILQLTKPSAFDAFNHAFGTHVTETEFRQAVRSALAAEESGGENAGTAPAQGIGERPAVE